MPVETHTVSLKPVNFFTANPALDVPVSTQAFNKSRLVDEDAGCCSGNSGRNGCACTPGACRCKGGECGRDAKL